MKEIYTKNADPNQGLLEGLFGITIVSVGTAGDVPPNATANFAEKMAEKRLTCNDEEFKTWIMKNLMRLDQDTRDQIIFEQFQESLSKAPKKPE